MKTDIVRTKAGIRGAGLAAVMMGVVVCAPLSAFGAETTFTVSLAGPVASGDPDGLGEATVTLNPDSNEVSVRVNYSNIARPTAMYLRMGDSGPQGNIAVPIVIERSDAGTAAGSRISARANIVATILASPEQYYLVVVNEEYPVGALRGRLAEQ